MPKNDLSLCKLYTILNWMRLFVVTFSPFSLILTTFSCIYTHPIRPLVQTNQDKLPFFRLVVGRDETNW